MRVTNLYDAEPRPRKIAVGEFDGVHLGHREVIRGSDTVLTFEPHPLRVVRPEAARQAYSIVGTPFAGWFQFQPLYARIVKEQPDLLD